jgi:hypothetical protein
VVPQRLAARSRLHAAGPTPIERSGSAFCMYHRRRVPAVGTARRAGPASTGPCHSRSTARGDPPRRESARRAQQGWPAAGAPSFPGPRCSQLVPLRHPILPILDPLAGRLSPRGPPAGPREPQGYGVPSRAGRTSRARTPPRPGSDQAGLRALVEQAIGHLANAWTLRRWRGLLVRVRDVFRAAGAGYLGRWLHESHVQKHHGHSQ